MSSETLATASKGAPLRSAVHPGANRSEAASPQSTLLATGQAPLDPTTAKRSNPPLENRPRGAIVYLAQLGKHSSYAARWGRSATEQASVPPQMEHLRGSLSALYLHYNSRFGDPVIIFHNGDFSKSHQEQLRAARFPELEFVEISARQDAERRRRGLSGLWDPPSALNTSEAAMATWQGWRNYGLGYRQMIRWYALKLWVWADEEGYEYIWRMDDDSFLHSPINYHLFSFMRSHRFAYGFRQVVVDRTRDFADAIRSLITRANATDSLRESMLLSFFTQPRTLAGLDPERQHSSGPELFANHLIGGRSTLNLHLKQYGWSGLGWYNNFFISEVAFWKGPQVQDFLRLVDESHLIFTKRLNDLQIQSVTTQLFLRPEELVWFDDWSYSHATILNKAVHGGNITYGGLSVGGSDPSPEALQRAYRAEHQGHLSSASLFENPWPLWGDFGDNSRCQLPMVQGVSLNSFNGWHVRGRSSARIMQQLAAEICTRRELELTGLYCPPPDSQDAVGSLAFRQHPKGLAYTNDALHVAYLPIPKVMSTTIRNIFTLLNNSTEAGAPASEPWTSGGRKCPNGALSLPCANGIKLLDPSLLSGRYAFAVVREPLRRFLSGYQQISRYQRDKDPWQFSAAASMGFWSASEADERFENFVRETVETAGEWDAHVLPQFRYLEGYPLKAPPQVMQARADPRASARAPSELNETSPADTAVVHLLMMEDPQGIGEALSREMKAAARARAGDSASDVHIEQALAIIRQLSDPQRAFNVGAQPEGAKSGGAKSRGVRSGGKGSYLERGLERMEALSPSLRRRWCALYAPDYSMLGYPPPPLCTRLLNMSSAGIPHPRQPPVAAAATGAVASPAVRPEAHGDGDAEKTRTPRLADVWRTAYEPHEEAWSPIEEQETPLPPVEGVAAVVLSFDHASNVQLLARELRNASRVLQTVVIDDGSSDGASQAWAQALAGFAGSGSLLNAPNLHEIRAYNLGARLSAQLASRRGRPPADVLCFLQDDDVPMWAGALAEFMSKAEAVLNEFTRERLAVVSGRAASLCGAELGALPVDRPEELRGSARRMTHPIPFERRGEGRGEPFMFVTEAWLAPLCVRRDAFEKLHGLDEAFSRPGEPGVGVDINLALRALRLNLTVGLLGSSLVQGVGGHGSTSSEEKLQQRARARERASVRNREVAGCSHGRWPRQAVERAMRLNANLLNVRKEVREDV